MSLRKPLKRPATANLGLDLKATASAEREEGSTFTPKAGASEPGRRAYYIIRSLRKSIEGAFRAVEECQKPVIAVTHGYGELFFVELWF